MSEYYLTLCDGLLESATKQKLKKKPMLVIYNDCRQGRAGANLKYLLNNKPAGVDVFVGAPLYYAPNLSGDIMREEAKRYPNARLAPHIGRSVQGHGLTNMRNLVYETFANGARGFMIFSLHWNNAKEIQGLQQGLRDIKKIEDLIYRSKLLDKPFDLSETVRIRSVGCGDEKFILVAQYKNDLSYRNKKLQQSVTFNIPTTARATVMNLKTGKNIAIISPDNNAITLEFKKPDAVPLYIKPIKQ
jgi:hypothetical protein